MSLILNATGNSEFKPAPEGQYQAVCVDVIDKGMCETSFGLKHKLGMVFQIEGERMENGSRYTVFTQFTASLHENSALRPFLEAWRGRAFSDDELKGFDIEKLIGANAFVQIIHNESNDKTYANIQSIMPVPPAFNLPKLEAENYTRKQDRPEDQPQRQPAFASAPARVFTPPKAANQYTPATPAAFDDDIPF